MATYTSTANRIDSVVNKIGTQEIDVVNDAFGVMLITNAATPLNTMNFVSQLVANEVSGNGYSRQILTGVTWTASGGGNGQMMLDANNPAFGAVGGSIVARYYAVFDNTPATDAAKQLISWGLINNADADVTTTDGNSLTLNINANGIVLVG